VILDDDENLYCAAERRPAALCQKKKTCVSIEMG